MRAAFPSPMIAIQTRPCHRTGLRSNWRSPRLITTFCRPSSVESLRLCGLTARVYSPPIWRRPGGCEQGSGFARRVFSSGPRPVRPSSRGYTLLAALGTLVVSGATVLALEGGADPPTDPLTAFLPDNITRNNAHLTQKPWPLLLRSYLTLLLSEIPGLPSYGPVLLNHCVSFKDNVPIIGPALWSVVEWFVYQTFFSHYTGGVSAEDCRPVMEALYGGNVGTILNYSVEATEGAGREGEEESGVSGESVAAISQTMETLASYELGTQGYAASSAHMKPTAVAIKISGLVTDPHIFKRASDNLHANGLSPFRLDVGSPFPPLSPASNDPLSPSDHLALDQLMHSLRTICQKAKAADIVLMMDAEYSWFQPALDRITTFLSAEFNAISSTRGRRTPTVFNTFQAVLRSTPGRLREYLEESERRGFSVGVKLVRGAYLVSETARWREGREAGRRGTPDEPPVWACKADTDACFDSLASALVRLLATNARMAHAAVSLPNQPPPSAELALIIAGHNSLSAAKVLKQLRDQEGLAHNINGQSIHLSDSLRGRLMFAQLYGMADDLTTALTQVVEGEGQGQAQPFVFKYVPFGPVAKVLPYLARRAEENASILQAKDGLSLLALQRKAHGKEIRKRIGSLFVFP